MPENFDTFYILYPILEGTKLYWYVLGSMLIPLSLLVMFIFDIFNKKIVFKNKIKKKIIQNQMKIKW